MTLSGLFDHLDYLGSICYNSKASEVPLYHKSKPGLELFFENTVF
jgi:hypothetical protein